MKPPNPPAKSDTWLLHVDRIALEAWRAGHPRAELSEEVGEGLRLVRGWQPAQTGALAAPDFVHTFLVRDCLVRFALRVDLETPLETQLARAWSAGVRKVVVCPLRSFGQRASRMACAAAEALGFALATAPLSPDTPHFYALGTGERVLCGVARPRDTSSPFPAGRFVDGARPSRAGAKLAEGLAYADAFFPDFLARDGAWLELGAFPGGMSSAILDRAAHLTAVDRRERPSSLASADKLAWHALNVEDFRTDQHFDALVSDLNGPPLPAARTVARLAAQLAPRSLVFHTLKLSDWDTLASDVEAVRAIFAGADLELLAVRHFCANRRELTLIASSQN